MFSGIINKRYFFEQIRLFWFSLIKVPMIGQCNPRIFELSDEKCILEFPLKRKTRNHLNSMYFGVFAIGCDLAAGFFAMHKIKNKDISLVFKDFSINFHKRLEENAHFICEEHKIIDDMIQRTSITGDRVSETLTVYVLGADDKELYASSKITLSIKKK